MGIFDPHAGSRSIGGIRLPDFGLTELVSPNKTAQGGSNLTGAVGNYPTAIVNNQSIQGPGLGWYGDVAKSSGLWQDPSRPVTPNTGGSVLATQTQNTNTGQTRTRNTNTGGSGNPSRDAFNQYRSNGGYGGWNENEAWLDWQATGGSKANQRSAPAGPSAEEIYAGQTSDAYGPAMSALDEWQRNLETNKTQNLADVTSAVTQGQQSIAGQQKEGEQFNAGQNADLSQNLSSALSEAVRYYNALRQQGQATYGGASSTGRAVGELAQQAFLKNQGQLQNTAGQGFRAVQEQSTKLKNYIQDKTNTLDQWMKQANSAIQANFTNALSQIGAQKGAIGANQTNAKLAALQYAQQQAQAVKDADNANRQQLATWAVQQAQAAAQRGFSPQEISGIYNQMMGQNLQGFTGQRVSSPSALSQIQKNTGAGSSTEEQLRAAGLIA